MQDDQIGVLMDRILCWRCPENGAQESDWLRGNVLVRAMMGGHISVCQVIGTRVNVDPTSVSPPLTPDPESDDSVCSNTVGHPQDP
jgi:hypothetical protein